MAALLIRRTLRVSLTLAAAAVAGLAAESWAAEQLAGQFSIQPAAVTSPQPPNFEPPRVVGQESRRGQAVILGNRIASGPGSGVKFTLDDRTSVIIGPNSAVSVDEFAADRVVLRLERGSFLLDSANPGSVYVVMPAGSVAVKAATVGGRIGPDATEIALLSVGRAEVTGFGGHSVKLEQIGAATRLTGLAGPSQPAILPPQRLQDFVGLSSQLATLKRDSFSPELR